LAGPGPLTATLEHLATCVSLSPPSTTSTLEQLVDPPRPTAQIPIAFYSFSFEPATEFSTQWPGAEGICRYYHRVVDKYRVRPQIVFRTVVDEARFSRSTGLWTVQLRNVVTGETRTKTCNTLVSAVGALSTPADAPFDTTKFDGAVMHSARWDKDVSLKDKDVVVLGNGCSAAQLVPAILPEVKSLTQIARAKHAIVPPNAIVDNAFTNGLYRWIPGVRPLSLLAAARAQGSVLTSSSSFLPRSCSPSSAGRCTRSARATSTSPTKTPAPRAASRSTRRAPSSASCA